MPKADATGQIDTSAMGRLVAVNTPRPDGISDKPGLVQCVFDTGIELYVPPLMFDYMLFELQHG